MPASSPSDGPPPGVPAIQTAARLLAAGRAAEAAERLRQLVREAPTYAAAHVLLASALDAAGRPADALDVWRRAAFLVPHSPLVHRERQRLVDAQSDRPAAPETETPEPETPEPEAPTAEAWDTAETDPASTGEGVEPQDLDTQSPGLDTQFPGDEQPESDPRQLDVADLVPFTSDERPAEDLDERATTASPFDGADPATGEPDADEVAAGDSDERVSDEARDAPQPGASDAAPEEPVTETIPLSGTVVLPPLPGSADPLDVPEGTPPVDASDLDSRGGDGPLDVAEGSATDAEPEAEMPGLPLSETPLLSPEGHAPSPPPPANDELEDDGWTLIEDDAVSPPRAARPEPTPLLPAEAPRPEPPPESVGDAHVADDLDDLISQLDAAPRIKPDPTFQGPAVTFDESSMDGMASETLAKIYAAQHQYAQAARIYETLAAREPDRADAHLGRAAELRGKAGA